MPAIDPHDFFDEKFRSGRPMPDDLRRLVELLWEAYGESVYLFACAKLQNREDARDIVQDTFLAALKWITGHPMPLEVNFPAWLRRIARNLIISRFRRPAIVGPMPRRSRDDDGADEFANWSDADTPAPDARMTRQEELGALAKCLEALSERRRRIVVLCDLEGCSYQAIAEKIGSPVNTVGVLLFRARKELRDCVETRLAQ